MKKNRAMQHSDAFSQHAFSFASILNEVVKKVCCRIEQAVRACQHSCSIRGMWMVEGNVLKKVNKFIKNYFVPLLVV